MILRLTGVLEALDPLDGRSATAQLELAGLLYAVDVPNYAVPALTPLVGQPAVLFTLYYLEGTPGGGNLEPRLLGFPAAVDRAFFERFTTVKGIGYRKALRALARPPGEVARWIENGDAKALATLPEIGKRSAETIIVELRGRLGEFLSAGATVPVAVVATPSLTPAEQDAVAILVAWGDRRQDAEQAVTQLHDLEPTLAEADAQTLVRAVYRHRGRRAAPS